MNADPMDVVFALLDARRRQDIDAVTRLLDPRVTHQGVTPELMCHDRDEVLHNVRSSFRRGHRGVDRLELIRAGDHVVVGLAGPGFRDAPWAALGDTGFVVHTVRDGRVVAMHDFVDRAEAVAAAEAQGSPGDTA